MQFEVELIKFIQNMRSGFMDTVMKIFTEAGDQLFFIGIALMFYWFINKKDAFKLVFTFILSAVGIVGVKNIVKRPRPYIDYPDLNVGARTSGYSFPSGHAHNIAVISTTVYDKYKLRYKWLNYLLLAAMIIVPFTRLYLGQHYLTDVLAGLAIGIGITFLSLFLINKMGDKENLWGLLFAGVFSLALIGLLFSNMDYANTKDFYVAVGGLLGFMLGYHLDKVYIKYDYFPVKWHILYRLLLGGVLVGIFYLGLKPLFNMIAEENGLLDALRYFIVAMAGTALSSLLFKKVKI